ncbi:Killer protein [Desulfobacter hydrogenophilus]|uniref:Killer protein n=1 Tax=Desulfobacter hydrogenophilus TaxID=2291 RepID=A0A328FCS5_9BACT|nr:type II toxin-antitoxin system RelE/ParE family toxin [Desulfobacter hydrogenophilus]NDY72080.1 Killer protein [Desulfobacter hydrogenophilus]QBH11500.1 Killer protein [Desulfobacter hydrogenophilus]RAM02006.1 Killer protein [Desulfobacter hydrogenophilus]
MIKSFKHKGLRKFFETGNLSGVQPGHKQKLRIRLIALDSSTCIDDMNTPGWRLHSLKGNRQGLWAIDVNKNWRIVFECQMGSDQGKCHNPLLTCIKFFKKLEKQLLAAPF